MYVTNMRAIGSATIWPFLRQSPAVDICSLFAGPRGGMRLYAAEWVKRIRSQKLVRSLSGCESFSGQECHRPISMLLPVVSISVDVSFTFSCPVSSLKIRRP